MRYYHGVLHDAQQGYQIITRAWTAAKPYLLAGHRLEVVITPEKRSSEASAKFHAICGQLAKSRILWFGKPRSAADWKVLLVSGHAVATKEGADVIPGLEGEFVNIRESTALMSRSRSASLIDYSLAYCAAKGVEST